MDIFAENYKIKATKKLFHGIQSEGHRKEMEGKLGAG
jgi:hypothetical protein